VHNRYLRPLFAVASISFAFAVVVYGARVEAQAPPPGIPIGPTSPPTTAPGANPAATVIPSPVVSLPPSPSPEPRGRRRRSAPTTPSTPAPEPSSTPTSPAFATLDGSWEVQLQYIDHTDYSYLDIAQGPNGTLTGNWRVNGRPAKLYPFNGTYDGRTISLLVAGPKGNITWSGYVEAASDMVGTVDLGDGKTDKTAFTAEHRPSSKGMFFKEKPSDRPQAPGAAQPLGH
jgi:hypothetical protein